LIPSAKVLGRFLNRNRASRLDRLRGKATALGTGILAGFRRLARRGAERAAAKARIDQLTRLYQMLSRTSKVITRARDEAELYRGIVKLCVEIGQFSLAWVGAPDPAGTHLRALAKDGGPALGYLDGLVVTLDPDLPTSLGPSGTAFREGQPVLVQDWATDPRMGPWRGKGAAYGLRSSGALPILRDGQAVSVLTFYSSEPGFFEGERLRLLEDLAADLGFALDKWSAEERRWLAEVEMQASEQRFRVFFEHSAIAKAIVEPSGRLLTCNAAFCEMTGYPQEELADMPLLELTAPEDRAQTQARISALLEGEAPERRYEKRYRHRDGHAVWAEVSMVLIRDPVGAPMHFVKDIVDISERKQFELGKAAAESATQAKSAFLAHMTHEIRTPLNAVLGFSQLLLREQGLTPRQEEYLRTINQAGDHLLTLVDDVLDLSRIEAGHASLAVTSFDLDRLVAELVQLFHPKAEAKGLVLAWSLGPEVPRWLRGDAAKLRQILINLLGNAVKFTEAGSVDLMVRGRPSPAGWSLALEVQDTGPGIAPEDLARLFTTFGQGSEGAAKGGTGLGLALSRKYARMLGGELEVRTEWGRGSVFILTLEMPAGEPEPGAPSVVARRSSNTPLARPDSRVLIVDDQEDNRMFLKELLESWGFEAAEAGSGLQALAVFEAWHPQVVLTDLRMPGMDGCDVIRRIRAADGGQRTRIIAVTASALGSEQQEALAAGANAFLAKPFRLDQLLVELETDLALPDPVEDPESRAWNPAEAPLDPALAGRMRRAAVLARYDDLVEQLDILGDAGHPAAEPLRAMLERFDYTGLLECLEPRKTEVDHG
jgi:PAS domain S-box-containing protein